MSLFDDNFVISMEAKAEEAPAEDKKEEKACDCGKEDCPVCNPPDEDKKEEAPAAECKEEGEAKDPAPAEDKKEEAPAEDKDDEDELELDEADEADITAAVDTDIEADSVEEATGFDSLISDDLEDAHYACMEAVTSIIAFDQADIACTEAYVKADSRYEKNLVTESFKDSVKKFGARFNEFITKIKNAVVRIFTKAVNYVRILASRISAKFASKVKLDKSKAIPDGVTVRVNDRLKADFKTAVHNVFARAFTQNDPFTDIKVIIGKLKDTPADEAKAELAKVKMENKKAILDVVMREGYHDVELKTLQGDGDKLIAELKTIGTNVGILKEYRKEMEAAVKASQDAVKANKDIDTAKLNVLTACVNKLMSCFNSKMSAAVAIQSAWINQRVRIVKALGKYQGKEMPKAEESDEDPFKGMHESANLFNDFLAMIH